MGNVLRRLPGLVAAVGAGVAPVGLLWRPSGNPVAGEAARGHVHV